MKRVQEIKNALQTHLPELHERFHVAKIALFGSHARGDALPDSDIDILVALSEPLGLDIVDLHERLEQLLGAKVDLVTEGAVVRKPYLWQSIREDLVYV